jgi:hypothetical protein
MAKPSTKKSPYSVHPGVAMVQSAIARLKENTGRTLDEWIELVKKSGPAAEKDRREWLKERYNLGTNYSWWIAEQSCGKGTEDTDPEEYLKAAHRYVEEMYSGGKAGLRPIYDRLLELGLGLAKDVKACPCKTIVPLYRNHVIAQIKPTTRTRVDFGFALGAMRAMGRLIDTGGFVKKDRITHRIPISKLEDIDDEIERWLKTAYDLDA